MARTVNPETRPNLLAAAERLFYARGVGPVSLDDIAEEAGSTKPTLYRCFHTKDTLVAAYLDHRHDQLGSEVHAWIEAAPPRTRPQAVVDWACHLIALPEFNGCAFVRTYTETHLDPALGARARQWKQTLLDAITGACRDSGVTDPDLLARQLQLIVEGAMTLAFVTKTADTVVHTTRALAATALHAAGLE